MLLLFVRRNRSILLVLTMIFYTSFFMGSTMTYFLVCGEAPAETKRNELSDTDSLSKYEYAVIVISAPDNEVKRDTVRVTWGKLANNLFTENGELLYKWNVWSGQGTDKHVIKMFFVLGTSGLNDTTLSKLRSENSRTKDLLLLDSFKDSYNNLATKMLESLKWLSNNMNGLKYLIKCDDDSYVRIDLIIKELEAFGPDMDDPTLKNYVSFKKTLPSYKGLYWGYFDGRAKARLTGKWKETDWFLCDNYLPYALGGGYVLSRSIVDYIGKNADMLSLYNSEDVSMGVWTASLDAINRVHDIRFDTEWKSRGCSESMLILHKQSITDMFLLHRTLEHSHGAKLCKTEIANSEPYMYKWNVLPGKCCRG